VERWRSHKKLEEARTNLAPKIKKQENEPNTKILHFLHANMVHYFCVFGELNTCGATTWLRKEERDDFSCSRLAAHFFRRFNSLAESSSRQLARHEHN
jgi:hypothetical protein